MVPDSGTDQLTGLAGTMAIIIADGIYFYAFDYTLDGAALGMLHHAEFCAIADCAINAIAP